MKTIPQKFKAEYLKLESVMDELINCVDSPFGVAKHVRKRMDEIEAMATDQVEPS